MNYVDSRSPEERVKNAKIKTTMTMNPMGVSQWKNLGKKYGYWKFFEKKQREEIVKMVEGMKKVRPTDLSWNQLTYEGQMKVYGIAQANNVCEHIINALEGKE